MPLPPAIATRDAVHDLAACQQVGGFAALLTACAAEADRAVAMMRRASDTATEDWRYWAGYRAAMQAVQRWPEEARDYATHRDEDTGEPHA